MENNSKKQLNIELFGLPGVGKSFLLEKLAIKYNKKVMKIEKGFNFFKLRNIIIGIFSINFQFLLLLLKLAIKNKESLKLMLVLLERIGRIKRCKNCILDEGILQAIWGLFFRIGYREEILYNLTKLPLFKNVQVVYISLNKNLHKSFLKKRNLKGFLFEDDFKYNNGRKIMFNILCFLRNNSISFIYIKNK